MFNVFLIFLGSGLGGLSRYWTIKYAYLLFGREFPYGTLAVNIIGSFIMGVLTFLIQSTFNFLETQLRGFLLAGLLGGYTTFSTFSIDTFGLLESGHYFLAATYILLSIGLCLISVWLGYLVGKQI
jgi:CrcB protein